MLATQHVIKVDRYDTSKKQRAPSWCDRIFTRGIVEAVPGSYGCLQDLRLSDHRPVFALLHLPDPTKDHAPAVRVPRSVLSLLLAFCSHIQLLPTCGRLSCCL